MINKVSLIFISLSIVTMLTGCGSSPIVTHFEYNNTLPDSVVWPERPDIPRFRYVGELRGDSNFITEKRERSILDVIVGLLGSTTQPRILQRPQSGWSDNHGKHYVTDISRRAIYAFDTADNSLAVWENSDEHNKFVAPIAITAGRDGELLVSDAELASIVRLDRSGKPLGKISTPLLQRPTGIAYDKSNQHIYVADTYAHDIKVLTYDGLFVKSIGTRGEANGEFNFPTHIYLKNDILYVSDSMNSRIQLLDTSGKFIRSIGARGVYVGNMPRPKGVTVDSAGNIYIIESFYDHLLVYSDRGEFLLPIGGAGAGIGQFYLPSGVWSDANDRIYIADMFNGRVVVLQYLGDE